LKTSAKRGYGQHQIKSLNEIELIALLKSLWPYLMVHKARVVIAMALLVGAKSIAL
jgi:hypothetical protein